MENPRFYDTRCNVIARAIAAHVGGEVKNNADNELFENWASVIVPANPANDIKGSFEIGVDMRGYGVKKDYVTFRVVPLPRNNDVSMYGIATPEISCNGQRELSKIVGDVAKRLLNNPFTIDYVNTYHKRLDALLAAKAGTEGALMELFGNAPNVRSYPNARRTSTAADFGAKYGTSFDGTIYNDGTVTFSRIGSVDNARALRILAILAEKTDAV